jgi:hypothetical protein
MRALGGVFVGVGAIVALIAGGWGRSGFYVSQAPILVALAVAALICLGIGAGMLRYQKTSVSSVQDSRTAVAARAFATPTATKVARIAPAAPVTLEIDEVTRDRPARTTDWVLVLPDHTEIPVADALVIGRQPLSADGGPAAAVPSPEVSKSHARFRVVDDQLQVRDLDSTNGTMIVHPDDSEQAVSSAAETVICDGDRLEIGSYVLQVRRLS